MPELTKYSDDEKSLEVYQMLGKSPSWLIRKGILVITIVVAVLLVVSYLIKYPETVRATFTLTSNTPPQHMIANHTGKIVFFVRDGDSVSTGANIALVENQATLKDVKTVKSLVGKLLSDSLTGEQVIGINDSFSQHYNLGELDNSYTTFLKTMNKFMLTAASRLRDSRIRYLGREADLYKNLGTVLDNQKSLSEKELGFTRDKELTDSALFSERVIAKNDFNSSAKNNLQQRRTVEQTNQSIIQNRIMIAQLEKEISELRLQQSEDLRTLKNDITISCNSLLDDIESWEKKYLLQAATDGVISFTKQWQNNDYTTTGEEIAVVIPASTAIYGSAQMPSAGIGKVTEGQRVIIRLDGFPSNEYGVINGVVKSVSPVTHNGGYRVTINMPGGLLTTYGQLLEAKPGLQGNAEIVTKNLRLIDRFLNSLKEIFYNQ